MPGPPSEAPPEPCLLTVSVALVLAPTLPGLLTLTLLCLWALTLLINTPKTGCYCPHLTDEELVA